MRSASSLAGSRPGFPSGGLYFLAGAFELGDELTGPVHRGACAAQAQIEDQERKRVPLRARDRPIELAVAVIVRGEPIAIGLRLRERGVLGRVAAEEDLQQVDVWVVVRLRLAEP